MFVQVGFKYDINLERILYTEYDHDIGNEMKIVFDTGVVLNLKGLNELNDFEKHIKHNQTELEKK